MEPTNDQQALTLTMLGEARGEGPEGMQAVGNTVMNRLALKTWFGFDIEDVCTKKLQYSCWNAGDPNLTYIMDLPDSDPLYQQALGIATGLIAGTIGDITDSATHYYRIGTPMPSWALGKASCAHIGHHLFFKDIA